MIKFLKILLCIVSLAFSFSLGVKYSHLFTKGDLSILLEENIQINGSIDDSQNKLIIEDSDINTPNQIDIEEINKQETKIENNTENLETEDILNVEIQGELNEDIIIEDEIEEISEEIPENNSIDNSIDNLNNIQ